MTLSALSAHSKPAMLVPVGRATIGLTGLAYGLVALALAYLDRSYGGMRVDAVFWGGWACMGFAAGMWHVGSGPQAGRHQWLWLGGLGSAAAFLVGLIAFTPLRWIVLMLMVVIGARAAVLKTRHDLYLTLVAIFVVSFMVGTHQRADWTLWFYLGPAWLAAALALAWDHASGVALSRWTKALMTLAFVAVAWAVAVTLFLFAPRPPILGFGFLPPGTDTPGRFNTPAGGAGQDAGPGQGDGRGGASGSSGPGAGGAGPSAGSGASPSRWGPMLQEMRKSLADPHMPAWQRRTLEALLGTAQDVVDTLEGVPQSRPRTPGPLDWLAPKPPSSQPISAPPPPVVPPLPGVMWWVLAMLLAYGMWRRRYRVGVDASLVIARWTVNRFPRASVRLSAQAMHWCLQGVGHRPQPAESVREYWGRATQLAPLPRRWLHFALEAYCAMRFGEVAVTPARARALHEAVLGASQITRNLVPEFNRAS